MTTIQNVSSRTKELVQLALFAALIVIMAFTPFIGYIPLGFTRATIIHIPVILGSLLLGPKKGAILGALFGLTSLINNTINPTITSFVFTPFYSGGNLLSLVICFVPRILVGIVPYYVYKAIAKFSAKKSQSSFAMIAAGITGSLTNTLLVMNFIYIFFNESYAAANAGKIVEGALYKFILSVICINGIPEAIVAAILVVAICRVMIKLKIGKISIE